MLKFKLILISLLLVLSISSCVQDQSNVSNERSDAFDTLVVQINKSIHPIESPLPKSPLEDLSPLDDLSKSIIIGLGEATHGTREFFQLKHKIFRYLVKYHNVRVLGMEADMGESFFINEYIHGGKGELSDIMKNKMHFWTWKTEEVKELLEWMRTYNEDKAAEKLYYIGLDTQHMRYQPDLIEDYIVKTASPGLIDDIQPALKGIRNRMQSRFSYQSMTEGQKEEISECLNYLLERISEHENELIASSSHFEYHFTIQLVKNLQQVHENTFARENDGDRSLRDRFMAENAIWISDLFGEDIKVALWAHNGHITKREHSYIPMGYYLRKKIGEYYKNIGFSFSSGSFKAIGVNSFTFQRAGLNPHTISTAPVTGSVNELFHSASENNFILNLDSLQVNSDISNWLSEVRPFLQIGAVFNGNPVLYYRQSILTEEFNFIIHYDTTSHSIQLK